MTFKSSVKGWYARRSHRAFYVLSMALLLSAGALVTVFNSTSLATWVGMFALLCFGIGILKEEKVRRLC